MMSKTLLLRSNLTPCAHWVVGILNVTPDSFSVRCDSMDEAGILRLATRLVNEGADMLDIGGYSTRPDAEFVTVEEEWRRVEKALQILRTHFPQLPLSIDTFRGSIAGRAVDSYRADIINDVSGLSDPEMETVLSRTRVPYFLTHPREACLGWGARTPIMSEIVHFLASRLDRLHRIGVKDVVIDPGIGFGKTREQDYCILSELSVLNMLDAPIMVGLSHKRIVYEVLGSTPNQALNGTTALHTIALMHQADLLRVHDPREAKETIRLVEYMQQNNTNYAHSYS